MTASPASVGRPLVSIGLPVRNGARYLSAALDSILGQDYEPIELIVSDNASTDATEAICRDRAARDPRVRYVRSERNRGAVWNFRRVLELGRGEYFMWAAHDDERRPAYVRRCVEALSRDPGAVLCCTGVQPVDELGNPLDRSAWPYGIRPTADTVIGRVRQVARASFWYDFYGLMRADVLRRTRGPQPVWGFDVVLLLEMCMRGRVAFVPEPLFAYRAVRSKAQRDLAATLAPETGQIPVSWSDMAAAMIGGIWRTSESRRLRLAATFWILVDFCTLNPTSSQEILRDAWRSASRALRGGRPAGALARVGIWFAAAAGLPAPRYWRYAGRRVLGALRRTTERLDGNQ